MTVEFVESSWFGIVKRTRVLQNGTEINLDPTGPMRLPELNVIPIRDCLKVLSQDSIEYVRSIGEPGSLIYKYTTTRRKEEPEIYTKDEINTGVRKIVDELSPQPRTRKPWVKTRYIRWRESYDEHRLTSK